jgi:hypothetical protein
VRARGWALVSIAAMMGCSRSNANTNASADADASTSASANTSAEVAAEAGASAVHGDWIERIELPDGGLAFVTPPSGAIGKRPIIVAIHGAVDDPGLMCGAWRIIADVYPFVVCPAGTPIGADAPGRKYVWGSTAQIEKRALQAITAIEAKYPDHIVAGAPAIYTAFSQGATMAGPLLARNASRFPRAVLTEGGHHAFEPDGLARAYAKAGGQRVLMTCSQGGCAPSFQLSRDALDRAGVATSVVFSGAHGHSMPPPVRESIHGALAWLTEGLAGWEDYATATKLDAH